MKLTKEEQRARRQIMELANVQFKTQAEKEAVIYKHFMEDGSFTEEEAREEAKKSAKYYQEAMDS